jgi:hypothetical protein
MIESLMLPECLKICLTRRLAHSLAEGRDRNQSTANTITYLDQTNNWSKDSRLCCSTNLSHYQNIPSSELRSAQHIYIRGDACDSDASRPAWQRQEHTMQRSQTGKSELDLI